jgi:hypothetical protein
MVNSKMMGNECKQLVSHIHHKVSSSINNPSPLTQAQISILECRHLAFGFGSGFDFGK